MNGEVSAAQIERVARQLENAKANQCRMVVTHQPVAVTLEQDRRNLLRGQELAVMRWAAAGADLIVGGHIHLPCIMALHKRSPQLPRPVWAVQAGTAVSRRVRPQAGNSVNVFRVGGSLQPKPPPGAAVSRSCGIERWDYMAATQRFERVAAERYGGDRQLPAVAKPVG